MITYREAFYYALRNNIKQYEKKSIVKQIYK